MFGFLLTASKAGASVPSKNFYLAVLGDKSGGGTKNLFLYRFDPPNVYTLMDTPAYAQGNVSYLYRVSGGFNPGGTVLASVNISANGNTYSPSIVLYSHTNGVLENLGHDAIDNYVYSNDYFLSTAISPDGRWLVVSGSTPYIWSYLLTGGQYVKTANLFGSGLNPAKAMAFSPDGNFIAMLWSSTTCRVFTVNGNDTFTFKQDLPTFGGWALEWSDDSLNLAVGGDNGATAVAFAYHYNGSTFQNIALNGLPSPSDSGSSRGVAWTPNKQYLAVTSTSNSFWQRLYLFHKTSELVYNLVQVTAGPPNGSGLGRALWTRDGQHLICSGVYNAVDDYDTSLAQFDWVSTVDVDPATDRFSVGTDIDTTGTRRPGSIPWYWFNQETATSAVSGGQLVLDEPGGTYPLRGVQQNMVMEAANEYRVKLTFAVVQSVGGATAGIALINFGTYGYFLFGMKRRYDGSAYVWKLTIDAWNSPTNYYGVISESEIHTAAGKTMSDPIWLKILRDSNTGQVSFHYSFDAVNYNLFNNNASGFYDAPALALCIANETSGHAVAYFDDFERRDRVGLLGYTRISGTKPHFATESLSYAFVDPVTVPTINPYLKALFHFNNDVVEERGLISWDTGSYAFNAGKFGSGSIRGVSSSFRVRKLAVTDGSLFTLGADFAADMQARWVETNASSATIYSLFSVYAGGSSAPVCRLEIRGGGDLKLNVATVPSSTLTTLTFPKSQWQPGGDGTFVHLAVFYLAGTWYLAADGVILGSQTQSMGTDTGTYDFYIAASTTAANYLRGGSSLDEFRYQSGGHGYNGSNFTPPSGPYTIFDL